MATVVQVLGAKIDIFPSLHTAFPCFFALHAFRHREVYRWSWPLLILQAVNISVATVFLRWHYGIDTVAGVALAVVAQQLAIVTARREMAGESRQPPFEPIRPQDATQTSDPE